MGVFVKQLIPIDDIIADLVDMTDEDMIRMKPMLYKWAMDGDRRIGTYYEYKRKKVVYTVSNCRIPIPCDAVYIAHIIIGDPGCDCDAIWNYVYGYFVSGVNEVSYPVIIDGVTETMDFLWSNGNYAPIHFDWQIQGNDIVIENANLNGQTVSVLYYGYQEDCDGRYLVWNSHADPISLYLQLFIAKKLQWKNFKRMKLSNMELGYIKILEDSYHTAVRHCRASDSEPSPPKEDHVFALINNPISGKGNLYL